MDVQTGNALHAVEKRNEKKWSNGIQYATSGTCKKLAMRHSTLRYGTVEYNTVQYSTVKYSTVQYGTVQYSVI